VPAQPLALPVDAALKVLVEEALVRYKNSSLFSEKES